MELEGWLKSHKARRRAKNAIVASVLITLCLYFAPFAVLVDYPLILLSTLVHELGHAFTAVLVGGRFDTLAIYADGSGVARYHGEFSDLGRASISAGGLVGPALVAGLGFVGGRYAKLSRAMLALSGAFLLTVDILFVRNLFGQLFVGAVVVGMGWVAVRKSIDTAQVLVVFLSTQLALSVFSRGDYLFTEVAHTGAGVMPSDVAQMATALGGPYWLWGIVCGAFSVAVLLVGVWSFARGLGRPHPVAVSPGRDSEAPRNAVAEN